ncbi:putative nucleoside diphosphate kinase [Hibiscus syriacus]|uniref:Nucleoside diphosphate kinase n=1 Tax=Hibiscus syriacus TaxID=106335 RepID=A0A6A2Y8Y0_HIBSY|nr:putative nucleoside diphosphate kinase [Hibiscus syriacus]
MAENNGDDCTRRYLKDTNKRLKRNISIPESIGSSGSVSNGGNNDGSRGMSRSASNVEEAATKAVRMATGYEEDRVEEDKTAYGMRLVQLLIACAEAVACHDKAHASALDDGRPRPATVGHERNGHQWSHLIQSLVVVTLGGGNVESNLENQKPEDIEVYDNEVLVVNNILQLHCVVKENRGALNSVLQMIHELPQKLLVLVEQYSSHNGPFFLGRFMEALHYYSATSIHWTQCYPRPDWVERHERVDQWQRRMSRAGFQAAPLWLLSQTKQWLGNNKVIEGYTVVEDKWLLVLGWKCKPIIAVSCWKC